MSDGRAPGSVGGRWRALPRATRIGAVAGALLALLGLGPIAVAVLLLRCCGTSGGADAGAWAIVGTVLLAVALAAGLVAGVLVHAVRLALGGRRRAAGRPDAERQGTA